MASFRQRGSKWQARIKRDGFPEQVKSFEAKAEAERWARSVESEMDCIRFNRKGARNSKLAFSKSVDVVEQFVLGVRVATDPCIAAHVDTVSDHIFNQWP